LKADAELFTRVASTKSITEKIQVPTGKKMPGAGAADARQATVYKKLCSLLVVGL
jgi:hypothetical protein